MDEKQKVLIVHNYYQIPGGEDTVVANEKKLLEDHGHAVVLYSRNNSELKTMSKVQKLLLPFTTVFNPKTYREIKQIIKEQHIGIVHVHNTLNLISPSVYYAAFSCKVPVVQTIHNFRLLCPGATFYRDEHICEDCVEHGLGCAVRHSCYRGSKMQTLMCVINTKIHRMLGTYKKLNYICLTEFTKEKINTVVPEKQIFIKPNFVYDFGGDASRSNAANGDYFVFVGRLEEIKGIHVLLDAFKMLPEEHLKIAGTGVLDEQVRSRVNEEKIKNVELLGFKERTELNQILKGAKALIMCSQWYETFGMVIAEAYSNGIPVIVGDIGNIKDLVVDGKTGVLFKYNSSGALRDAVMRINELDTDAMGKEGYKYYRENLAPESNYNTLMQIYRQVTDLS